MATCTVRSACARIKKEHKAFDDPKTAARLDLVPVRSPSAKAKLSGSPLSAEAIRPGHEPISPRPW